MIIKLLKNIIDVDLLMSAFSLAFYNAKNWMFTIGSGLSSGLLTVSFEGVPTWIIPAASITVLLLSVGVQFYKLLAERQNVRKAEAEAKAIEISNLLKMEDLNQAKIQTELDQKKLEDEQV